MRGKLCSTVKKWGSPAILVVGDFMLDTYVYGDASRISPEAPVPVLSVFRTEYRCGGAGSVAADIAALGGRAVCLGVTGRDRNGKILKSLLTKAGVQTKSLFAVPDRPTVSKQRLIGLAQHRHYQQLIRIDHESCRPLPPDQVDMVIRSYKENLNQADIVCLQDYDKGMLSRPVCSEIIQCARQADKGVIVDPALGTDYAKYNGALMVAPNRKEASVAVGFEIKTPHHAARSAKKLMRMFALGAVVITLDKDGAYLKTRDAEKFIPTKPRNVYDVTGAGDIVLAALAMTLARGRDFEAAVQLANIAGGIEVEKFGTAAVTVDEILAELHAQKSRQSGKVTAAHLVADEITWCRRRGKAVVLINGCFDVLTRKHIDFLEFCKSQGRIVVVALDGDNSQRTFPPRQPMLNSQNDRAAVLAALETVDYVVVLDRLDLPLLIEKIKPDVFVDESGRSARTAN